MRISLTSTPTGRIVLYGLISGSLRMIVGATSVIYLTAHGVSLAQVGAMKAMQAALILLLDIPLSYLADRKGRIYVLVGGNIATALWLGTTAYSTSVSGFFAAEAFNAIGLAAFNGVFTALLIDTYEKEHRRRDFENILGWYGKWQFFLMAVAAAGGAGFYMSGSPVVWWAAACGVLFLTVLTPLFIMRRRDAGDGGFVAGTPSGARPTLNTQADGLPKTQADGLRKTQANDLHKTQADGLDKTQSDALHRAPFEQSNNDRRFGKLIQAARLNARLLCLAGALVAILLTFQILLQFWQPVVESGVKHQDAVGTLFGVAFVIFLLLQSAASHCVQRSASVTHGWPMRASFAGCMLVMYVIHDDATAAAIITAIAIAFFVVKGLSIVVLADIQRIMPRDKWSMIESAISSVTRCLFIATMPFIGAFGDRSDAQSIFIVVLFFMGVAFICLAWAQTRQTFS